MKKYFLVTIILICAGSWFSYHVFKSVEPTIIQSTEGKCIILVSITLDRTLGFNTIYGEQPQIAVWLEDAQNDSVKTIYVTNRAGKDDWAGKIMCPVALPYWESRAGVRKVRKDVRSEKFDAVSSATPKSEEIHVEAILDSGSVWKYYVEVNLSGDYNEMFTQYPNSIMDSEGNGQPSLIYGGAIEVVEGNKSEPVLLGRTKQLSPVDSVITDVSGITTAKEIIKSISAKIFK